LVLFCLSNWDIFSNTQLSRWPPCVLNSWVVRWVKWLNLIWNYNFLHKMTTFNMTRQKNVWKLVILS
jgi:hypothetical protein